MISFLKIIAGINKKAEILEYRKNEKLIGRIPDYNVQMGFGLHIGWAIEGAIGSQFKIDASYLSPNVNMAARLEAATKQFGVPLLISHHLQNLFSEKVRTLCREIDRVTVKGSNSPVGLFTVDVDTSQLMKSSSKKVNKEDSRLKHKINKEIILECMAQNKFRAFDFFYEDEDLKRIIFDDNSNFRKIFDEAFQNYIIGNWSHCGIGLAEALELKSNDGPTKTLLNVLSSYNNQVPRNWKGFRELTEK